MAGDDTPIPSLPHRRSWGNARLDGDQHEERLEADLPLGIGLSAGGGRAVSPTIGRVGFSSLTMSSGKIKKESVGASEAVGRTAAICLAAIILAAAQMSGVFAAQYAAANPAAASGDGGAPAKDPRSVDVARRGVESVISTFRIIIAKARTDRCPSGAVSAVSQALR